MDKTNNLDIFMTDLADSIREATGETGSINAQSFSTRITGLGTGKQDKLVSGENIKTINGESILGSGDLIIESGGKKVVSGDNMGADITLKPNEIVLYVATIDNINVNGFEITPFDIESANPYNGYYDEYCIVFKTGIRSSTFSITLPSNVLWANGSIPEIEANTEYELSITRRAFNSTTYWFKAILTPFKQVE